MSDIYTPNTTGGEAGEFIHDELEELQGEEQSRKPNGPSNLLPVQEYEELVDHEGNTYTVPKPIEYPVDQDRPFISYDQYEAQDREKFDHATTLVSATDEHALGLLNQINEQKQEIINTMEDAFNSINTLSPYPTADQRLLAPTPNPNYDPSSGGIRGSGGSGVEEPPYIIPTVLDGLGDKVCYVPGTTTFIYPPLCVVTEEEQLDVDGNTLNPGRIICIPDENCCLVGMKAPIYPDIMETYIYPALEDEDIDADFFNSGAKNIELKSNTVGMGKTSFTYGDAGGYTGFKDTVLSYNSPLGYYYFWEDLEAFDSTVYDEIVSRISDIEYLRQELTEFISDNKVGTNNLRDIRHKYQLDLWYGLLSRDARNKEFSYDKSIDTLEDANISGIIQNYDS